MLALVFVTVTGTSVIVVAIIFGIVSPVPAMVIPLIGAPTFVRRIAPPATFITSQETQSCYQQETQYYPLHTPFLFEGCLEEPIRVLYLYTTS